MSKKQALALTKLDNKVGIPNALDAINAQIEKLKHLTDSAYKTSGQLEGFGDIKTEVKTENLIRAWSSVKNREVAYNDAAHDIMGKRLYPEFNLGGFGSGLWKEDITLRLNIIEHDATLKKLQDFKAKAEAFLSDQDKKAILFKEMADFAATLTPSGASIAE